MQPADKAKLTTITKRTATIQDMASKMVISGEDDLAKASTMLADVKTVQKEIKATKESIVKPLNLALKEIRALFEPAETNIATVEKLLKGNILQYHDEQEAAARKRIDSIENRIGAGRGHLRPETAMQQLMNVDQPQSNIRTENGGAQVKYGASKVRITSALELVQDHPSILNRERVLEALRIEVAADIKAGGRVPAGVEVYRDKLVAGVTR